MSRAVASIAFVYHKRRKQLLGGNPNPQLLSNFRLLSFMVIWCGFRVSGNLPDKYFWDLCTQTRCLLDRSEVFLSYGTPPFLQLTRTQIEPNIILTRLYINGTFLRFLPFLRNLSRFSPIMRTQPFPEVEKRFLPYYNPLIYEHKFS